jgi:dihydroorotate dehydrogenase electron transfer subunit
VALVAGGVGSAALLMLAQALLREEVTFDWIYGGLNVVDLAHGELFAELATASGGEYLPTTEDGTAGERGRVTGPLQRLMDRGGLHQVFTCGPDPMMAAVAELGARHGVVVQAALETPMGCGYGACLGCVVPLAAGGMELCCRSGPVFNARRVAW